MRLQFQHLVKCGQNDGSSVYTPHVHFCTPPPTINSESYSHVDGLLNVAHEMNKPKAEIQSSEVRRESDGLSEIHTAVQHQSMC